MKNVLLILTITICVTSCQSNTKTADVPKAIQARFKKDYPDAGKPTWELENGRYEAAYTKDNQEVSVTYNIDGTIFQTETDIDPEALPQPIRDYVATELENNVITGATKIILSTGEVSYEAEVDTTDYLFDGNGQYTGVEENTDTEKDDND